MAPVRIQREKAASGISSISGHREVPRGSGAVGAAMAAWCGQGGITYLLLGAASRRFRGAGVANRPLIRLGQPIQRWQVIATYSLQPRPLHLSFAAIGTEPVISS